MLVTYNCGIAYAQAANEVMAIVKKRILIVFNFDSLYPEIKDL